MSYLYTFLGVTVWVVGVSLSSNALIANDNKKQIETTKTFVEETQQKSLLVASNSGSFQRGTQTPPAVKQKQTEPTSASASTIDVAPVTKPTPPPVKEREEDEDEGEDD